MCGIAGVFAAKAVEGGRIARAQGLMRRRGPDGEAVASVSLLGGVVTFLHSRLAIVDLDARSDQPFIKDGLALVFNGEIYNHIELRAELQALGHHFTTSSDTEVILEAWRAWGDRAMDRFEGMWAFALADQRSGRLVLSRDRFGEKPLFWWWHRGALYFASEIKVLAALAGEKPVIDEDALCRYLVNGYKAIRKTGTGYFRDVLELPLASTAVLEKPGRPDARPYWRLDYRPDERITAEQAEEEARRLTHRAIALRLRADVPVSMRLSGGIDSNVVAGVAASIHSYPVHTFSIVEEDERYNETANIRLALQRLGCAHTLVPVPKSGNFERLRDLCFYFDAPVITITYLLQAVLSEEIRKAGFKVALGGTGADEVFTGYYDHYLFWLAELQGEPGAAEREAQWRGTYGRFVTNPLLQDPRRFVDTPQERGHIYLKADEFSGFLKRPFAEAFRERDYTPALLRNRMLNELAEETVPVMLHDDDLAGMRHSVENRAPYLDRDLAEFLFRVPSRHLIQQGLPKYLLRQAGRGVVADAILDNPRKTGFNAPVTSLFDLKDRAVQAEILADGPLFDLVHRDRVASLLNATVDSNADSKFLFSLIAVKMFLETQAEFQP